MPIATLVLAVLSTALPVRLIDDDGGRPIAAQVIAWEDYFWSGFHSSGESCFRAAGTRIGPEGGAIELPPISPAMKLAIAGDFRHIGSFAFARGECAVEISPSKSFPAFTGGIVASAEVNKRAEGMRPGESVVVHSRRSREPAEYRLLYLEQVAKHLASVCFERKDRHFTEGMAAEILAEAETLPRTFHERFLVQRIREALARSKEPSFIFNPLVRGLTMGGGDVKQLREMLDWTGHSPTFQEPWCRSDGRCTSWQPPKGMFGPVEPFDVDLRVEGGHTALIEATSAMNTPAVRLLLGEGADPNVVTQPGGLAALDFLLLRAERDVNDAAPDGVEFQLLRTIDELVATGATLHPANRHLLSNPQDWKLGERARQFWSKAAAHMASTSARPELVPVCSARPLVPETLRLGTAPAH